MTEARFIPVLTILIAGLALFHAPAGKAVEESTGNDEPLNILLILSDQFKSGCSGFSGSSLARTPNLDRLARKGSVFSEMYVQAPSSHPSRASMVTSRYRRVHKAASRGRVLYETETTLAEVLSGDGFKTAHVGILTDPWSGLNQGFQNVRTSKSKVAERNKRIRQREDYAKTREIPELTNIRFLPHLPLGGTWIAPPERTKTAQVTVEALDWMARTEQKQPFFLWVDYPDPHPWWAPPPPYDRMYSADEIPLPYFPENEWEGKPAAPPRKYHNKSYAELPRKQIQETISKYYGEVSFIDHEIGRIMAALKELGAVERTVIVFLSDHGEMLYEHGYLGKDPNFMYDALIRVPFMIVAHNRIPEDRIFDVLAESIDLYPTLLDIVGSTSPQGIQGKSLVPILQEETLTHRPFVFSESGNPNYPVKCLRDREYKYVYRSEGLDELYHVASDPSEFVNLLRVDPAVTNRYMRMLLRHLVRSEDRLPSSDATDERFEEWKGVSGDNRKGESAESPAE